MNKSGGSKGGQTAGGQSAGSGSKMRSPGRCRAGNEFVGGNWPSTTGGKGGMRFRLAPRGERLSGKTSPGMQTQRRTG
ncbi:hypothetical protein B0G73_1117 [Paraburkholderia sp. BL25I1N1]|nr:hypothetical protein B0G73_1117 [Paraburkholderia sp. BL25I1N1]